MLGVAALRPLIPSKQEFHFCLRQRVAQDTEAKRIEEADGLVRLLSSERSRTRWQQMLELVLGYLGYLNRWHSTTAGHVRHQRPETPVLRQRGAHVPWRSTLRYCTPRIFSQVV